MLELPHVSDLTPSERKARVQILPEDKSSYPEMYYWPFEKILKYARLFPTPPTEESERRFGCSNWAPRYNCYSDWAVPFTEDDCLADMMRMISTQSMYGAHRTTSVERPAVQLKQLFAAPFERSLREYSTSPQHKELQQKIFVMKYSLAPFMTSYKKDFYDMCDDENVRVWRLIACYGETHLDTLHDRILGPTMGWVRHYHSYQYMVPTNGACFGPKESSAIDQMHVGTKEMFMLDASKYQLCHVLRELGKKLLYIYDLGDGWMHNIELLQIADKGDVLELPKNDKQVSKALEKRYGSKLPELFGAQLFAGELNCAPEDSNGCGGMGKYGNILKKGPRYCSREAASSMNWRAHHIDNAYEFDIAAHTKRLAEAIAGKSSAKYGHKVISMPLGNFNGDPLKLDAKAGEKRTEQCLGSLSSGCLPMHETVKTRPDKAREAVCATCGRQPSIEKGKKTPLLRCSSCKGAWYCARDCQMADWDNHKGRCRAMKKERAKYKQQQMKDKENKEDTVD